jgi:hypothetical protein
VVLEKVFEWCDYHKCDPLESTDDSSARRKSTDIDEWGQKFFQVDQEMVFEIILVRSPNYDHRCCAYFVQVLIPSSLLRPPTI